MVVRFTDVYLRWTLQQPIICHYYYHRTSGRMYSYNYYTCSTTRFLL